MITVDFSSAVGVYLFVHMLLVMVLWVIYNYKQRGQLDTQNSRDFKQCPYCCSVFFDYQHGVVTQCPQCKSLMDAGH